MQVILSHKTSFLVHINSRVDNRATINGVKIRFYTRHSDEIMGKKNQLVETLPPYWEILVVLFYKGSSFVSKFIALIFVTGRLF